MAQNQENHDIEYRGDDPAIQKALERVKPITLEAADWSVDEDGQYGVIDGFLAVVDGRSDLDGALQKARELIQKAEFENVTVIRQSSSLAKSKDKISDLFWNATFGKHGYVRPDKTTGLCSTKQGMVLLDPDHDDFYLKVPASQYSATNLLRDRFGLRVPDFVFKKSAFWNGGSNIGKDFKKIFGAAGKVFPEYMSILLSNGQSTSEPGLMHFDSAKRKKAVETSGVVHSINYNHLPESFLKAASSKEFEPLPGNVTVTASIVGGGSIVRKTNAERYGLYKEHERNQILLENKVYFQDDNQIGYQGQDGDIMIIRNDGWPDDEHGNPRLPSDHCSTIINAYGNHGNHLGRMAGIMSSQVCYMSPQVHEQFGLSHMPEAT